MAFPLSLTQEEYETLVAFARRGTLNNDGSTNQDSALGLDAWLRKIEGQNGVNRYAVWVQWQEQDQPLPPTAVFPEKWPPELRAYMELISRPISRIDVEELLKTRARRPMSVLVTKDPAALVGWTELDAFFK